MAVPNGLLPRRVLRNGRNGEVHLRQALAFLGDQPAPPVDAEGAVSSGIALFTASKIVPKVSTRLEGRSANAFLGRSFSSNLAGRPLLKAMPSELIGK